MLSPVVSVRIVVLGIVLGVLTPRILIAAWPVSGCTARQTRQASDPGPALPRLLWRYRTGDTVEPWYFTNPPPVIGTDGTVYLGAGDGAVHALHPDGSLRWRYETEWGIVASPAVSSDGTVYAASMDGYLHAVDSGGDRLWRYRAAGPLTTPPVVDPEEGTVYVSCGAVRVVYALLPDGELKWESPVLGGTPSDAAAVAPSGTVIVPTVTHPTGTTGYVYGLDPATGDVTWAFRSDSGFSRGAVNGATAVGPDGTVYFGADDWKLRAIRYIAPDTPVEEIWGCTLGGEIYGSPALGFDGTLYTVTVDGQLSAVSADGTVLWQEGLGDGAWWDQSPSLDSDGRIYVGGSRLQVFEPDGSLSWSYDPGDGAIDQCVAVGGGLVCFSTDTGCLCAVGDPNWSLFRGDTRRAGRSPFRGPARGRLKWKLDLGGNSGASPCLDVDGTIYMTGGDSSLFAVEPSGVVKWRGESLAPVSERISSPAVSGGRVYSACFDGPRLRAWTLDGEPLWTVEQDTSVRASVLPCSTGIYTVANGGEMRVFDRTGQELWSYQIGPVGYAHRSSPAATPEGIVYVGSAEGSVYAFDLQAPERLKWQSPVLGTEIRSTPAIGANGTVYIGSSSGRLSALDPADGSILWQSETGLSTAEDSSPALDWTGLVVVGSVAGQALHAFDAVTGASAWACPMDAGVRSSPAIDANDTVYVGSDGGFLHAVDKRGRPRWRIALGGAVASSPAIGADGMLYVGCADGTLCAVGEHSWSLPDADAAHTHRCPACGPGYGSLKWRRLPGGETGGAPRSSPVFGADGVLYLPLTGQGIAALYADGSLKWRFDPPVGRVSNTDSLAGRSAALAPGDATVYYSSGTGVVYALATATGSVRWQYAADAGLMTSLPVVGPYRSVYVGLAGTDTLRTAAGGVIALDPETGAERWRYSAPGPVPAPPAVALDGSLYAACGDGHVCCLDRVSGQELWRFPPDDSLSDCAFDWSPALADDGTVLAVCSDRSLYALTPAGVLKWQHSLSALPAGGPAVAEDGTILVAAQDGTVTALLDIGDMPTLIWQRVLDQIPEGCSPSVDAVGTAFVGTRGSLCAIGREGSLLWETPLPADPGSPASMAPDGTLYLGTGDGFLCAIGPYTWPTDQRTPGQTGSTPVAVPGNPVPLWCFQADGSVRRTSVLAADGTLYVPVQSEGRGRGRSDAGLHAITPSGHRLWTFAAELADHDGPALGPDGTLFLPCLDGGGRFYAIGPDGKSRWAFDPGGPCDCSPGVGADGTVFLGTVGGWIHAFASGGGNVPAWSRQLEGAISGPPAVGPDRTLYVSTRQGMLYAVRPGGVVDWELALEGELNAPTFRDGTTGEGTVYVTAVAGALYAVHGDGSGVCWSLELMGDECRGAAAVGADGTVYAVFRNGDTVAVGTDGSVLWRREGPPAASAPVIDGAGVLCVGTADQRVLGLDTLDGSLRWSFDAGADVVATPVIGADGRLFVGTVGGRLYALGPGNWNQAHCDGSNSGRSPLPGPSRNAGVRWRFKTGGQVAGSPVVGPDGTLYVGVNSETDSGPVHSVCAIDASGERCWEYELGGSLHASPALGADGTLYIGTDEARVYALSRDGSLEWVFDTDSVVRAPVTIGVDGTLYVVTNSGTLYALTPTGLEHRHVEGLGEAPLETPSAVAADGTVYVQSGDDNLYTVSADGEQVQCIQSDATGSAPTIGPDGIVSVAGWNGEILWASADGAELHSSLAVGEGGFVGSPAVSRDGTVYAGSAGGTLHAIYWDGVSVTRRTCTLGSAVTASPVMDAHDLVYVGCEDGFLHAVRTNGYCKWSAPVADTALTALVIGPDSLLYAVCADGVICAVGETPFWPMLSLDAAHTGRFALDGPATADARWTYDCGDVCHSSPVVDVEGTVYMGTDDGRLHAVRANGQLKWELDCGDSSGYGFYSSPALSADGSTLYVTSGDGRIHAVCSLTGAERWRFEAGQSILHEPVLGPDGTVYAADGAGWCYALLDQGDHCVQQWKRYLPDGVSSSCAVGPDGTVYVKSTGYDPGTGRLHALTREGAIRWSVELAGSSRSSPPAIGPTGIVYVCSQGTFYSITDAGSAAAVNWSFEVPTLSTGAALVSVDGGTVYLGTWGGDFYALTERIDSYVLKWHLDLTPNGAQYAGTSGAPIMDRSGRIYVGTDRDYVYALQDNGVSGEVLWAYDTGNGLVFSSPALGPGSSLYFATSEGRLHAVGPKAFFQGSVGALFPSEHSQPSTVMLGGSLNRYLHLVDSSGNPLGGAAIGVRLTSDTGRAGELTWYTADDQGFITMGFESEDLGSPGDTWTCSVEKVGSEYVEPPITFQLVVAERESEAHYRFGTGGRAMGTVVIGLTTAGDRGFDYTILSTDPDLDDDDRVRIHRSLQGELGVAAGAGVGGGVENATYAEAAIDGSASLVFLTQNDYLFDDPYGANEQNVLRAGLIVASLCVPTASDAEMAVGVGIAPLISLFLDHVAQDYNPAFIKYKESEQHSVGVRLIGDGGAGAGVGVGDDESTWFGIGLAAEAGLEVLAMLDLLFGYKLPRDARGVARDEVGAGFTVFLNLNAFAGVQGQLGTAFRYGLGGETIGEMSIMVYGNDNRELDRAEITFAGNHDWGLVKEAEGCFDDGTTETMTLILSRDQAVDLSGKLEDIRYAQLYLQGKDNPNRADVGPDAVREKVLEIVDVLESVNLEYRIEEETGNLFEIAPSISGKVVAELELGVSFSLEKSVNYVREHGFVFGDLSSPIGLSNQAVKSSPGGLAASCRDPEIGDFIRFGPVRFPLVTYEADSYIPRHSELAFTDVLDGCFEVLMDDLVASGKATAADLYTVGTAIVSSASTTAASLCTSLRSVWKKTGLPRAEGDPNSALGRLFLFSPDALPIPELSGQVTATQVISNGPCTLTIEPGAARALLSMVYGEAELEGVPETDLRLFHWDTANRQWSLLPDGLADPESNTVTAGTPVLGTFALGVGFPCGEIRLELSPRDIGVGQGDIAVIGGPIRLATGAPAPDGTLVTVATRDAMTTVERAFGDILAIDSAPDIEGVQVSSVDGMIGFGLRPPTRAGRGTLLVRSVEGLAVGRAVFHVATELDVDGNGLPDFWERGHLGDTGQDPDGDADGDGLSNRQEYERGTAPESGDSDGDGMDDLWETGHGLDPTFDDGFRDSDHDGLGALDEYCRGSDLDDDDSDDDAWIDGRDCYPMDPVRWAGGIAGVLQEGDGRPLAGMLVEVWASAEGRDSAPLATTRTAGDGRFEVVNLDTDVYRLVVPAQGSGNGISVSLEPRERGVRAGRISDEGAVTLEGAPAGFAIPVASGWSLVSVPLHMEGQDAGSVLGATMTGPVWAWDVGLGGYVPAKRLEPGHAYWGYRRGPSTEVAAEGRSVLYPLGALDSGWNLVAPLAPCACPEAAEIVLPVWGWSGTTYFQAEVSERNLPDWQVPGQLTPGHGYWIYSRAPCEIPLVDPP